MLEDGKPGIPVFVGILVGLLASFVQSLGLTIQRKSHVQNDALPLDRRRKAHRRPMWLVGFAIFISSNLFGTVFQIGALPIVILAPLGAVSLLWNALLCRLLLHEHFSTSTLLGTACIAVGAVLIAVFGVVPEENHSLDELLELFARPAFVVYFTLMGVAVVGVLVVSHIVEFSVQRAIRNGQSIRLPETITPERSPAPSYAGTPTQDANATIPFRLTQGSRRWSAPSTPPVVPGALPVPAAGDDHPVQLLGNDGKATTRAKKHVTIRLPSDYRSVNGDMAAADEATALLTSSAGQPTPAQSKTLTLLGMAFAACSGTLSGMGLLFAKCAVELLILTFASKGASNQFKHFQSWVLVVGLSVVALAQLYYLNHALRLAGPTLIAPLAFCFYNISSIFDGLVFYSQFSALAPYQIALVTVGIAILLVGVWSVSVIEPSGQGGVEVNGWADDTIMERVDEEPYFDIDGAITEEPASDSAIGSEPSTPLPPSDGRMPFPGIGPESPSTPLSPTSRRPRTRRTSIQARFGTLIPDLAPPGVPAGFSIGLGTSSPGFVLRSVEQAAAEETFGREGVVGLGIKPPARSRSLDGSLAGERRTSWTERAAVDLPKSTETGSPARRRRSWAEWWQSVRRPGGQIRLADTE